jgi:hypothetical protein
MSTTHDQSLPETLLEALLDSWDRNNTILTSSLTLALTGEPTQVWGY